MKLLGPFRRLDIQLSMLVASVVGLWFVSSLISAHMLTEERAERTAALEQEKIRSKVEGESSRLLNDILLDHEKAIELTVSDIFQTLGLEWISFSSVSDHKISLGKKEHTPGRTTIEKTFPIQFEGKKYGDVAIAKELWLESDTAFFADKVLYGTIVVMVLIFVIIRLFIKRQIISPINSLISSYSSEAGWTNSCTIPVNSAEMEGLIHSFNRMKDTILDYQEKMVRAERQAALVSLASQVAHDIRSPLTALSLVNDDLHELPENKRIMVRSAVARIKDIANDLLFRNRPESPDEAEGEQAAVNEPPSSQLLSSLVESIVSEKRTHFRSRLGLEIVAAIDAKSYGAFAHVQPIELKRVLSNLINNACEAIADKGQVEVSLSDDGDFVTLQVLDNGRGIPTDVLTKLMRDGGTYEKKGGSGRGLFPAKKAVESWGGNLTVNSTLDVGTTVKIVLNNEEPPDWFVPELPLTPRSTIVVLDDDISIHQIWQRRFESLGVRNQGIETFHFSTLAELTRWHETNAKKKADVLYLFDYELIGQEKTGLDAIESLGIADQSILVTSRYEERRVTDNCLRLRVRLIPKALAAFVPLSVISKHSLGFTGVDCVLIDDDPIVHMTWKARAKQIGKRIRVFRSHQRFVSFAPNLARSTPIYIDSNLGNGAQGEILAKDIHAMGFHHIRLTTAFKRSRFPAMPWLVDIVGKEPPWPKDI